jgi:hypothetical protein
MNTDNDPRIERLKEVLSSSYPCVKKEGDLAPLPQSIIERLHPKEEQRVSIFSKMVRFFAQPLPALGAVAILTICAVLVFRQNPPSVNQGPGIRSGGETASTPQLIFINAPSVTLKKFQTSGYFPDDLLSTAEFYIPGESPAIVLDWKIRTMTRYLPGEEATSEPFAGTDEEVLERVLTLYQEALSE